MRTVTDYIVRLTLLVAMLCATVLCMNAPAFCADNRWSTNGPYGGMANAIVISPNFISDRTAFAAIGGCGVYKTGDSGANWSAASSGLPTDASGDYLQVACLAVSPSYATDHTVYAGTTGGVFKSIDGCDSWTAVLTGISIYSLAVSPTYVSDKTVFAGTASGVSMSEDAGVSWNDADTGLPVDLSGRCLPVYSLAVSPDYANDQTVFAGLYAEGMYKTVSGGACWSLSVKIPILCLTISPGYASDGTLFAGTTSGVYRTLDGGESWLSANTGLPSLIVRTLAVSPGYAGDHTVIAGTPGGACVTTESGDTWGVVNTGLGNLDISAVAVSPAYTADKMVFAGTRYDGVYKATGPALEWARSCDGIIGLAMNVVVISPDYVHDRTAFAGTNGGGVFKSADGGAGWIKSSAGLPKDASGSYPPINSLSVSPDYADHDTVVAGTGAGLFISTDGGSGWAESGGGIIASDIRAVTVSPAFASDGTIYAGTYGGGVFVSRDGGANWQDMNTGLDDYYIKALAVLPLLSGGYRIFAGTGLGVFVTTEAGGAWTMANNGLVCTDVSALAASPYNDMVFAGTTEGLYRYAEASGTWTCVSGGVSGPPDITALAVSPQYEVDATVFIGRASDNLFKYGNAGETWAEMDDGLTGEGRGGGRHIASIAVSPDYAADGTLFACSSGGGVYVYPTAEAVPPVSVITNLRGGQILSSAYCVVKGTASGANGRGVQTVEVSTDGGASWHGANGTVNWKYTWRPKTDGVYVIVSRATDASNLQESPGPGVDVLVDRTKPVSAITSPGNCTVSSGTSIVVHGTAMDAGAGVRRVEVSTDGGHSWRTVRDVSGDASWSAWSYTFTVRGNCALMSRATDRAGNVERPAHVTTVRLQPAVNKLGLFYYARWR